MAWKSIIGQDRVKNILQRSILENRVAHAYCIWGLPGVGKEALAIEFAKTVNCLAPVIEGTTINACGSCHSCKQFEHLQHPNFEMIFSLPVGKQSAAKDDNTLSKLSDEQIDAVKEQIFIKSQDYYHKIEFPNATQIKINPIRELKRNLSMTSMQNGRRVVLICDAEQMTTEAANAFLKTLEEPHDNVTIFLTSSRIEMILPTILSRSQQLRCEPLNEISLADALMKKKGLSAADAKLSAAFSQGSYRNALNFLNEDMKQHRENIVSILRCFLKKRVYRLDLLTLLEPILSKKDKVLNEKLLSLLLIWIRDAFIISKTGMTEGVINIDQIKDLTNFANKFGNDNLISAITVIENAVLQIRRNVQSELIYLNMIVKLRNILLNV